MADFKKCTLCKHVALPFFKGQKTQYWRCLFCRFVFAPKVPTAQYQQYHRYDEYLKMKNYLQNIFRRLVLKVQKYKKSGSVLEIGSSVGFLLEEFSSVGFKIEGVEPSTNEAKLANEHGIPTRNNYFEHESFSQKYDVVILNHVLEHIPNFTPFFEKVTAVLKNDGILAIQVPNFGSLEAQVSPSRWRHLIPNEHYWQFTPHTLKILLYKHDFSVVELHTTHSWDELASYQRELQRLFKQKDWKRAVFMLLEIPNSFFSFLLNRGAGLEVIAVKNPAVVTSKML